MGESYYAILHVDRMATCEEITRAYRKLALKYHPDKSNGRTTAVFQQLTRAHEVLRDPLSRAMYDKYGPALRPNYRTSINEAMIQLAPFLIISSVSFATGSAYALHWVNGGTALGMEFVSALICGLWTPFGFPSSVGDLRSKPSEMKRRHISDFCTIAFMALLCGNISGLSLTWGCSWIWWNLF